MPAKSLMFQGSDVGKSMVVAGLCRLLARRGIKVVPFKAQNMSNNAAVTQDGGEIGRAQWLQALAAGVTPSVHMNPVLLKPQSDKTSQVILRGKVAATMSASDYQNYRASLLPSVLESYHLLAKDADFILVEGAGSPAEINLRANDIANMGFARAAHCPAILVGDIERGGVIASMVGTHVVLAEEDKHMIRGFLINKFRGDANLFSAGAQAIETRTGWKNLGLIPHFLQLAQLPQEDSLNTPAFNPALVAGSSAVKIVVLTYPHLANFDDLDPLAGEPGVELVWLRAGEKMPEDAKLVILPGSKSTIADLAFVRAQSWDQQLQAHVARGGKVLGICGGYQMLGNNLSDPHGVEGAVPQAEGLGLLDIDTVFTHKKIVTPWQGEYQGSPISGYEIHCGMSQGQACARPLFSGSEGACSEDNRIWGTYIHGLFVADGFRHALLKNLGAAPSNYNYVAHRQQLLNDWADVLEESVSIEALLKLAMPVTA